MSLGNRGKILALDDTPASLRLLCDILKADGYEVMATDSGELALHVAHVRMPELILCDLFMPEMDGFEFCSRLKADPRTRDIPLMFISGSTLFDERLKAFEFGAVDFVSKPFRREELLARVRTQLNLFRLSQNLEAQVQARTQALEHSEARFRVLIEQAPEAIFVYDVDNTCVVDANPRAEVLTGLKRDELIGQSALALYDPNVSEPNDLIPSISTHVALALSGNTAVFERGVRHQNGHSTLCEVRLVQLPGERRLLRASFIDISARHAAQKRAEYLARHDVLTGLSNRFGLFQHLEQSITSATEQGEGFAILTLDLDGFKFINDWRGHAVGDVLLSQLALRLKDLISGNGVVTRPGGDEFIVVLQAAPPSQLRARAKEFGAQILREVGRPFVLESMEFRVTASIGLSLFPEHGQDIDSLMRNGDLAMYQSKRAGGGQMRCYDIGMSDALQERLTLEADLAQALDEGQFELYYQPQIDLCSDQIVGMESLIRWSHPTRGLVSPAIFIPIAEQSGLIIPLGAWVMREACRQLMQWRNEGLADGLTMAVNVSPVQFSTPSLLDEVKSILNDTGLPPECLDLEITESSIMASAQDSINVMQALRKLGVLISVDDFGTGYSSLAYLRQFPLNYLKIDQSFVRDIGIQKDGTALCQTITMLAHQLGFEVIAEGVETQQQLEVLRSMECELAQGFFFSRPLPAEKLKAFMLDFNRTV